MQHSSLGGDALARLGVIERCDESRGFGVRYSCFDAQRTLPDRRQHDVLIQNLRNLVCEAQALQTSDGKHNRIKFASLHPLQPRIDIAA
jgi:hypothetical protein